MNALVFKNEIFWGEWLKKIEIKMDILENAQGIFSQYSPGLRCKWGCECKSEVMCTCSLYFIEFLCSTFSSFFISLTVLRVGFLSCINSLNPSPCPAPVIRPWCHGTVETNSVSYSESDLSLTCLHSATQRLHNRNTFKAKAWCRHSNNYNTSKWKKWVLNCRKKKKIKSSKYISKVRQLN